MSSSSEPGGASWLSLLPFGDKLAHLGLYTVLGATLAWGRSASGSRLPHGALLLAGVLYGVSDEWHQSFVPGRDPSAGDLAADALGVFLGYATAHAFLDRRTRARAAPPPGHS